MKWLDGFPALDRGRLCWCGLADADKLAERSGFPENGRTAYALIRQMIRPVCRPLSGGELARSEYALGKLQRSPRLRELVDDAEALLESRGAQLERAKGIWLVAAELVRSASGGSAGLVDLLLRLRWLPGAVREVSELAVLRVARLEKEKCIELAGGSGAHPVLAPLAAWCLGRMNAGGPQRASSSAERLFQAGRAGTSLIGALLMLSALDGSASAGELRRVCAISLPDGVWPMAVEWFGRCLWMGKSVGWCIDLLGLFGSLAKTYGHEELTRLQWVLAAAGFMACAGDGPAGVEQVLCGPMADAWLADAVGAGSEASLPRGRRARRARQAIRAAADKVRVNPTRLLSNTLKIWTMAWLRLRERPDYVELMRRIRPLLAAECPVCDPSIRLCLLGRIAECLERGIPLDMLENMRSKGLSLYHVLWTLLYDSRSVPSAYLLRCCGLLARLGDLGAWSESHTGVDLLYHLVEFRRAYKDRAVCGVLFDELPQTFERMHKRSPDWPLGDLICLTYSLYCSGPGGGALCRLVHDAPVRVEVGWLVGQISAMVRAGADYRAQMLVQGFVEALDELGRAAPGVLERLVRELVTARLTLTSGYLFGSVLMAACRLADRDENIAALAVRLDGRCALERKARAVAAGAAVARRIGPLRDLLRRLVDEQVGKGVFLLELLGRAERFGSRQMEARLSRIFGPVRAAERGNEAAGLPPALADAYAEYARHARALKEPCPMPGALQAFLDRRERLGRELAFLEGRPEALQSATIRKRAESLRRQLADEGASAASLTRELHRLRRQTDQLIARRIEAAVTAIIAARLTPLGEAVPESLLVDDNWLNALDLLGSIRENRPLLRELLAARLAERRDWAGGLAQNVSFRKRMSGRGILMDVWESAFPRRYRVAVSKGPQAEDKRIAVVEFAMADDPLEVLQMGNRFSTCLSVDGCNAFSVVANAADLNKRVIYARARGGEVVGRRLVAMLDDGQVVAYCPYHFPEYELDWAFYDYVRRLAEACKTRTADEGVPSRLVAGHWYNDGTTVLSKYEGPAPAAGARVKESGKVGR